MFDAMPAEYDISVKNTSPPHPHHHPVRPPRAYDNNHGDDPVNKNLKETRVHVPQTNVHVPQTNVHVPHNQCTCTT